MSRYVCSMMALVVAAGCSSGSRTPGTPTPVPVADSSQSVGVVASATGAAHRIREGEVWVLTFTAQKRADGSVNGYAHVDRKDLEVAFDIDVTCMSVADNVAWIAGIIRNQRGDLARNGTVSYFYVTDNGEGSGVPDRASAVRLNDQDGEDQVFCTERPVALPDSEIAFGNVQVR